MSVTCLRLGQVGGKGSTADATRQIRELVSQWVRKGAAINEVRGKTGNQNLNSAATIQAPSEEHLTGLHHLPPAHGDCGDADGCQIVWDCEEEPEVDLPTLLDEDEDECGEEGCQINWD